MTSAAAPAVGEVPPDGPEWPGEPASRGRLAGPARTIGVVLARRVAAAAAVMLGAATTAFVALHLLPGDPVAIILGPSTMASPQARAQIRTDLGLDAPIVVQFLRYLGRLLQGDLGRSYQLQQPVS